MPILSSDETNRALESSSGLPQVCLDLDSIVWVERGPESDPRSRLCAVLLIGGINLHIDAYEAWIENNKFDEETGEAIRFPLDYEGDSTLFVLADGAVDDLWRAHGMEGGAETVEIDDRHYCIFMHPFCT